MAALKNIAVSMLSALALAACESPQSGLLHGSAYQEDDTHPAAARQVSAPQDDSLKGVLIDAISDFPEQ